MTYEEFDQQVSTMYWSLRQLSRQGRENAYDDLLDALYAFREAHPEHDARMEAEAEAYDAQEREAEAHHQEWLLEQDRIAKYEIPA